MFFLKVFFSLSVFTVSFAVNAQMEEYGYFSESEIKDINTSLLIDSEYFSDILTYRIPLSMTNTFHRQSQVFNLSIGSLSRTRFANQLRLKADTQLNESFTFRIAYNEQKDLEQSINHVILELQYKLTNMLSLVGYTELMSEKKFNDFGFASILHLNADHQIRFFMTAVDPSFTQRTEDSEQDLSKSYAYGVVGRWIDNEKDSFLEYYARSQSPLQRRFIFSEQDYIFSESKVGFRGQRQLTDLTHFLNFDVSYKYKTEGLQALTSTAQDISVWRQHQWDIFLQYETSQWIYGLAAYMRDWNVNGQTLNSQAVLPHVWYKMKGSSSGREQLRLGYELTAYNSNGPDTLKTPPDRNNDYEHRGNLRYTLYFSENAFLHLQFTADLDDLSWEGGNGILQILL